MKKHLFVIILGMFTLALAPLVQIVPERPIIRLNVGNQTAEEEIYGYCWPVAERNNQCDFSADITLANPLQIENGQQVTVLVEGDAPNQLVLSRVINEDVVEPLTLPNPQQAIFDANYGIGNHIVQVDAIYNNVAGVQAFVSYRFAIEILPAGTTEVAQGSPTVQVTSSVGATDSPTEQGISITPTQQPGVTATVPQVTVTATKQSPSITPTFEPEETAEAIETDEAIEPTQEVEATVEVVETDEAVEPTQEVEETVEAVETDEAIEPTQEVEETVEATQEDEETAEVVETEEVEATDEATEEVEGTAIVEETEEAEPTATRTPTSRPTNTPTRQATATPEPTDTKVPTATLTPSPAITSTATTVSLGGTPQATTDNTVASGATATTVGIVEAASTDVAVQPTATSPVAQPNDPPAVVLVFAGQTYQPVGVNFCQTSETGELICVNRPLGAEGESIQLLQDFAVQVRLPAESPRPEQITFDFLDPSSLQALQSDVRRGDRLVLFNIDVQAGTYFLKVSIDWGTTQAEYFFRVRVS